MENKNFRLFLVLILAPVLLTPSCTAILTDTVIDPAVKNLQRQQDVELVCEGAASYLLMIDSLIESDPEARDLLLVGIKAYSGSASALVSCGAPAERRKAISSKARTYGKQLLSTLFQMDQLRKNDFVINSVEPTEALYMFWGAFGWLTWIQQQQGSPESMADLIMVEKIMKHVLDLDETVENGSTHIFFGALYGSKPAMIGGDFERSRTHFERALEISNRQFLVAHTTFAETYCRMTFNKELHDALLQEVLDFPLEKAKEHTLVNQIAKKKAKKMLEEGFFD